MATVVNDLVTKFSFQGSTDPLDEYNATLGESIALLGGMITALNAAAGAFLYWSDTVLTGVDSLDAISNRTDVAVGRIQELRFAAGQTQSSAEALDSSLMALNSAIGQAAWQGSEDFARLGISVRDAFGNVKTADVILEEVRQRFNALNLSIQEQEQLAGALGIDPTLLNMLNQTNAQMGALTGRARELGVVTEDQADQAMQYKQSLNAMWFALDAVKQQIAVGVAPQMTRLADAFVDLIADNKDWIVDGIQATIGFAGELIAAFNRLIPVLGLMAAGFVAMKIAALGFSGVMGILLSPVVLITAGVSALLLVIDDLIVAFRGGQSVIADFFQEFLGIDIVPIMHDVVDAVIGAFNRIKAIGSAFLDAWTGIFSGIGDLMVGSFQEGIDKIWKSFVSFSQSLYDNLFGPLFDSIRDLIAGMIPDWVLDMIGLGGDGGGSAVEDRQPMMPDLTAGSPMPEGTRIDNRRVEIQADISVSNNDPQEAGAAVRDELQQQLTDANTQLEPGGL